MDATNRPLHTLEANEVDSYIDNAIDRLFVPKMPSGDAGSDAVAPPDEPSAGSDPGTERPGGPEGTIEPLQEALLSLDWEVSEKNIAAFEERVRELAAKFPRDKHVAAVTQMAAGVCKYLFTLGEAASPLGVQFPGAVVRTLESLLREPAPAPGERKAAVEQLLEKYRRLQSEVRRRQEEPIQSETTKTLAPRADVPSQPEAAPAAWGGGPPPAEAPPVPARGTEPIEELPPEPEGPPAETREAQDVEELEPLEPEPGEEALGDAGEARAEVVPRGPGKPGEALASDATAVEEAPEPEEARNAEEQERGDEPEAPPEEQPLFPEPAAEGPADRSPTAPEKAWGGIGLTEAPTAEAAPPPAPETEPTPTAELRAAEPGAAEPEGSEAEEQPLPGTVPVPVVQGLRAELSTVRQTLAGLLAAVERIESQLAGFVAPAAPASSSPPASPEPAAPRPGDEVPAEPREGAGEAGRKEAMRVCLGSVGGELLGLPAELVAGSFAASAKQVRKIRERGYATLGDFRAPFRNVKRGLVGPLAEWNERQLEELRFPVVTDLPQLAGGAASGGPSGAAVLLSDGRVHAALFIDSALDRTSVPSAAHPVFDPRQEPGTPPS